LISKRHEPQTVRDACQLQPSALSIKLSDQIEQLDELITAEGDGAQFFEKTYITQGMQDLISEGMARLAGVSTQGVFHLKQAMGGGKTHLLVGFGLLAKHPTLRKQYCGDLPYAQAFGVADIAAFNGRNNPDHFFWGEIANQLGKGEQFKTFWTSGPKAPDEKDWLKLFDGGTPILALQEQTPSCRVPDHAEFFPPASLSCSHVGTLPLPLLGMIQPCDPAPFPVHHGGKGET
jgi:hypothetical protein